MRTSLRPSVTNFESFVVQQSLAEVMNRDLYGVLCSLGIQYIKGNDLLLHT